MFADRLLKTDIEIFKAIKGETERQHSTLELIASENFCSEAVLAALGSVLTNKYAEGLPKKRYYGGCEFVDIVESLAIERLKKLFNAEHANVQPHSGTQANMIAYFALAEPGAVIFGLNLTHGGHLSHGHPVNFSGKYFQIIHYGVDPKTEVIDYDNLWKMAKEYKPKIIVSGASAYPRTLYFDKFQEICEDVGAYHVADIAHIAGLVVAGLHPSPIPYADVVTTTTHKTLRGPRGAVIMCKAKYAELIDKVTFPGMQGGPLEHVIAAKAVAFKEAMSEEFKEYQKQIVKNAKALAEELKRLGYRLVADGTDTHLMLVDLRNKNITGRDAERALGEANITVNRNTIPYDPQKPFIASGIRLGTPALTTRGMKEEEMKKIAQLIDKVLSNIGNEKVYQEVKMEVKELTEAFPLYPERRKIYENLLKEFKDEQN
jgi:glycine hydroxymethyltransferase|uniref:Serine hydroxymethyltransferase n=1 Tax=candidate division WOR-3 bacterium TaxID=2052148 RepID=A0A7V5Y0G3_UNCW3